MSESSLQAIDFKNTIQCDNIEILVIGPHRERFFDLVNLTDPKAQPIGTDTPAESAMLKNRSDEGNRQENAYISKVHQLNKLTSTHDQVEKGKKTKETWHKQKYLSNGSFLAWSDIKRGTASISTERYWIDLNYNLISDTFLDPYINGVLTGSSNILVITFDPENDDSRKRALQLYKKLHSEKAPSTVNYQSQRLLLQQNYYHAYSDKIILGLSENPSLEPVGICLLVGFGSEELKQKMQESIKEAGIKSKVEFFIFDVKNESKFVPEVLLYYKAVIDAHKKSAFALSFDEKGRKEIDKFIEEAYIKPVEKKGFCSIF